VEAVLETYLEERSPAGREVLRLILQLANRVLTPPIRYRYLHFSKRVYCELFNHAFFYD
jgi:hypothetical protein